MKKCKDEPYHLHVNGRIEDIDTISAQSLYDYYQKVIEEDEIDLYIIGNIEPEKVKEVVSSTFVFTDRNKRPLTETKTKQVVKVNEVIEKQDVKQGKLNIDIVQIQPIVILIMMLFRYSTGYLVGFRIQNYLLMYVKKKAWPIMQHQG